MNKLKISLLFVNAFALLGFGLFFVSTATAQAGDTCNVGAEHIFTSVSGGYTIDVIADTLGCTSPNWYNLYMGSTASHAGGSVTVYDPTRDWSLQAGAQLVNGDIHTRYWNDVIDDSVKDTICSVMLPISGSCPNVTGSMNAAINPTRGSRTTYRLWGYDDSVDTHWYPTGNFGIGVTTTFQADYLCPAVPRTWYFEECNQSSASYDAQVCHDQCFGDNPRDGRIYGTADPDGTCHYNYWEARRVSVAPSTTFCHNENDGGTTYYDGQCVSVSRDFDPFTITDCPGGGGPTVTVTPSVTPGPSCTLDLKVRESGVGSFIDAPQSAPLVIASGRQVELRWTGYGSPGQAGATSVAGTSWNGLRYFSAVPRTEVVSQSLTAPYRFIISATGCSDTVYVSVGALPIPDLIASTVNYSGSLTVGSSIGASGTISNTGNGAAGTTNSLFSVYSDTGVLQANYAQIPTAALAAGISTNINTSNSWVPITTGNFYIRLCADNGNVVAESNASGTGETNNCANSPIFTINALPSFNYTLTVNPNPVTITIPNAGNPNNVGSTNAIFTLNGGSGPGTANVVSISPSVGGVSITPATSASCSPNCQAALNISVSSSALSGDYLITVNGSNDSSGGNSTTFTLRLRNQLAASCVTNPSSILVGQSATWSGSATGGTSPYSFTWSAGTGCSGSGCGQQNTTVTCSSATTYNGTVTARDSLGATAVSGNCSVSCTNAPQFDYRITNSGGITIPWSTLTTSLNTTRQVLITKTLLSGTAQNVILSYAGVPSGAIAGFDAGGNCSPPCSTNLGITMQRYSGGVGTAGTYSMSVTGSPASQTVGANQTFFSVIISANLQVNKAGAGGGNVISDIAGINCGADCSQTYTSRETVTLTASVTSGTWGGWTGCNLTFGVANEFCVVVMSEDRNPTATFNVVAPQPPDLTATSVNYSGTPAVGTPLGASGLINNTGTGNTASAFTNLFTVYTQSGTSVSNLGTASLASLSAGGSQGVNAPSTWTPTAAHAGQTFYIGLAADNGSAIAESSEGNNFGRSPDFTVPVAPSTFNYTLSMSSPTVTVNFGGLGTNNAVFTLNAGSSAGTANVISTSNIPGVSITPVPSGPCTLNCQIALSISAGPSATPNTYTATVNGSNDSSGANSTTFTLIIRPPLSVSCIVSPSSILVGQSTVWSATATGGAGGYTYTWGGDPSTCGSTNPCTKSYTTANTYTGTIRVTDSAGVSAGPFNCSNSLIVSPPSTLVYNLTNSGSITVPWSSLPQARQETIFKNYQSGGTNSITLSTLGLPGNGGSSMTLDANGACSPSCQTVMNITLNPTDSRGFGTAGTYTIRVDGTPASGAGGNSSTIFFVTTTANLTVTKGGTGTGTVTSGDGFINMNCNPSCAGQSHTYTARDIVTLTATPTGGSSPTWTACPGVISGNTCTVQMSEDRSPSVAFNVGGPTLNPITTSTCAANSTQTTATISWSGGVAPYNVYDDQYNSGTIPVPGGSGVSSPFSYTVMNSGLGTRHNIHIQSTSGGAVSALQGFNENVCGGFNFSVGVNGDINMPCAGGSSSNTAMVTNTSNSAGEQITLSASGLPAGATYIFNPNACTPGNTNGSSCPSTHTVTSNGSLPCGTSYPITVHGSSPSFQQRSANYNLNIASQPVNYDVAMSCLDYNTRTPISSINVPVGGVVKDAWLKVFLNAGTAQPVGINSSYGNAAFSYTQDAFTVTPSTGSEPGQYWYVHLTFSSMAGPQGSYPFGIGTSDLDDNMANNMCTLTVNVVPPPTISAACTSVINGYPGQTNITVPDGTPISYSHTAPVQDCAYNPGNTNGTGKFWLEIDRGSGYQLQPSEIMCEDAAGNPTVIVTSGSLTATAGSTFVLQNDLMLRDSISGVVAFANPQCQTLRVTGNTTDSPVLTSTPQTCGAVGPGVVELRWAEVPNATGYEIWRCNHSMSNPNCDSPSEFTTLVATLGAGTTPATPIGPPPPPPPPPPPGQVTGGVNGVSIYKDRGGATIPTPGALNPGQTYSYRGKTIYSDGTTSNMGSAVDGTASSCSPITATCSVSPVQIQPGQAATWNSTASNGTGKYSFSWVDSAGHSVSGPPHDDRTSGATWPAPPMSASDSTGALLYTAPVASPVTMNLSITGGSPADGTSYTPTTWNDGAVCPDLTVCTPGFTLSANPKSIRLRQIEGVPGIPTSGTTTISVLPECTYGEKVRMSYVGVTNADGSAVLPAVANTFAAVFGDGQGHQKTTMARDTANCGADPLCLAYTPGIVFGVSSSASNQLIPSGIYIVTVRGVQVGGSGNATDDETIAVIVETKSPGFKEF